GRSFSRDCNQAQGSISAYHRNHQPGPVSCKSRVCDVARGRIWIVLDVRQMKHTPIANGLRGIDLGVERRWVLLSKTLESFGAYSMSRGASDCIALDGEDRAPQGDTDADPASGDRFEYRLHVRRRASD